MVIRLARPGEPTRLVDLGPAVGRITHARYGTRGSIGGVIVVPERAPDGPSEVRREQLAAAAARYRAGKR
jgi:hypothetical protein